MTIVGSKTESYKGTKASTVKQYGYFRHPAKFQQHKHCSKINDGHSPVCALLSASNMRIPNLIFVFLVLHQCVKLLGKFQPVTRLFDVSENQRLSKL